MIQQSFATNVVSLIKTDPFVIGLAAAGSWITNELDEYSDLDLTLITESKISDDKEKMLEYAHQFGKLISAFTGEHVGEPRVLICLYDEPLIHVDIKFLTLPEFKERVEDPVVLFERENKLSEVIQNNKGIWPATDLQWIEDRFWTWVHYIAGKIGRGELFECIDGLGFIRARVLAPMFQLKNNLPSRALRKLEMQLPKSDLKSLEKTVPAYDRNSIILSLEETINLYQELRLIVFPTSIKTNLIAEQKAVEYFKRIPPAQ